MSIVHCLFHEEDNEDEHDTTVDAAYAVDPASDVSRKQLVKCNGCSPSPSNSVPDDEAKEAWTNEGRNDETQRPQIQFSSLEMERVEIADDVESRYLRSGLERSC